MAGRRRGAEECTALEGLFNQLIASFIASISSASVTEKTALFETAIEGSNEYSGVIETGEREDLCELTNTITLACGLNPAEYGGGEGSVSEWRNW